MDPEIGAVTIASYRRYTVGPLKCFGADLDLEYPLKFLLL